MSLPVSVPDHEDTRQSSLPHYYWFDIDSPLKITMLNPLCCPSVTSICVSVYLNKYPVKQKASAQIIAGKWSSLKSTRLEVDRSIMRNWFLIWSIVLSKTSFWDGEPDVSCVSDLCGLICEQGAEWVWLLKFHLIFIYLNLYDQIGLTLVKTINLSV